MSQRKYYGKEKCRILKQIRAEIARQNDIAWVVDECSHKGNCRGTCPKCEAEVRQLEKALERRAALGKTVAVVGISAGLSLSVTGCANPFTTAGDMQPERDKSSPAANNRTENTEQTESNLLEFDGVEIPETDTVAIIEDVLMGDVVVEMGEIYIPETEEETETNGETEAIIDEDDSDWMDMPTAGDPLPEDYFDGTLTITVAETLPSCIAIEEDCFYGTDESGFFWRIYYSDTTGIVEGQTYSVTVGERTELTYPDGYPSGWTPQYEATATDVTG